MEEKVLHSAPNTFQLLIILIILVVIVFSVGGALLMNHLEYAIVGVVVALIFYFLATRMKRR